MVFSPNPLSGLESCSVTLPSGAFARISHSFTGTNVPTGAAVVYALELTAPPATPATVANAAHVVFGNNIMPRVTNDVTLVSTLCKVGPDQTGASALHSAPVVGGLNFDSSAPNTSWLITKNTELGGRRGRGRMYVPGVPELSIDNGGVLESSYFTAQQTAVNAWLAALIAAGSIDFLVLEHEPAAPGTQNPSPQPSLPSVVSSLTVSGLVATQRRRLRR
jgi:hypothetical protein